MVSVRSGEGSIDWSLTGKNRIAQNVRNLINTYRYEIPYHRTMGMPGGLVDRPSNVILEAARVEARALIAAYEPRANVRDVRSWLDDNGTAVLEVILA